MHQLEINFFWPLTEQIPLDLDHSNCYKPKFSTNTGGTFLYSPDGSYALTNGATSTYALNVDGKVTMNVDEITFRTSKKPNLLRKMLFNVMGIKLETK